MTAPPPLRVTLAAALNANALPWSHGSARNKAAARTLPWMYPRGRGRGAGRDITIDPHAATAWLLSRGHRCCAENMVGLAAAVSAASAAGKDDVVRFGATKHHNHE